MRFPKKQHEISLPPRSPQVVIIQVHHFGVIYRACRAFFSVPLAYRSLPMQFFVLPNQNPDFLREIFCFPTRFRAFPMRGTNNLHLLSLISHSCYRPHHGFLWKDGGQLCR